MRKNWPLKAGAATVLLVGLPLIVHAGELDSIFDTVVSIIKVLAAAILVVICFGWLIVILIRSEPPDVTPAALDNPLPTSATLSKTITRLSSSRVGHVVLLATPCYAAWFYVAAYDSNEFAAGHYAPFYAAFFLPTLGVIALLWRTKRPSAAAGLGSSIVLALVLGSTLKGTHDGSSHRYNLDQYNARQSYKDARSRIPDSLLNGVYTYVGQMPAFEKEVVRRQLRYPPRALAQRVEGNVMLGCVVDEVGNVAAVTLVHGIGFGCDEEAIRVIRNVQFRPGMLNARAVRVYTIVEVPFELPSTADAQP